MFRKEADFEAFECVMVEVHKRQPIRIHSYCVLSNHWHFLAYGAMSSGILYRQGWSSERNCGGGAPCGQERVALRRSRLCYRLGRWNGRRTGRLAATRL